jgi:eukaryotic-like serine/threonine-protein kinase
MFVCVARNGERLCYCAAAGWRQPWLPGHFAINFASPANKLILNNIPSTSLKPTARDRLISRPKIMSTPSQLPVLLTFGPFEVNTSTGELRKGGIRVRLPGQPFAILLRLIQHSGEVVTREQLRNEIWGEGTFVDFEHGLNAAMNKLRRVLGDSAETPRYIETLPGRGYRFVGALSSGQVVPMSVIARPELSEERPRIRSVALWERLAWAVAALVCLVVGLQIHRAPPGLPNWKLTRITADTGLSAYPALSPDGKLVAYSSDRGLNCEQDLYVRQVSGGQPIRLTFDGAGNTAPDFSPDGGRIVFQSNRNGGGIYEVPALGGEARLLTRGGLRPKYSPDGSQVAYWVGTEAVNSAVPGSGAVWVLPISGGAPRLVSQHFTAARQPIWLPDGNRLLFVGYTSSKANEYSSYDWWTAATDGADIVRTGFSDVLVRAGLQRTETALRRVPAPSCWSKLTNTVVFSIAPADRMDLWEIGASPQTGKVSSPVKRLTAGTLSALSPSCTAAGTVAFTSVETTTDVWSLPFDLNRGKPKGPLERVTTGPASREHSSLAKHGPIVAFASSQSGQMNIWVRDLTTAKEAPVASSSFQQHYPVSNATGDRIAFSVFEKATRAVYVSVAGGTSERVCEGCLRATDWSQDDKTLLIFGGDPYQVDALHVSSHKRTPILKHATYHLLYARYSPDNRWVSFTARTHPDGAFIAIAPLDTEKTIPESAWIKITEASPGDWAEWSPDGKTLYFTSARDGHSCLWGQRIDVQSHRPSGEPFAALHLHGRVYYQPGSMRGGWSVGDERIAMLLAEDTGNIWTMSGLHGR